MIPQGVLQETSNVIPQLNHHILGNVYELQQSAKCWIPPRGEKTV